MAATAVVPEPRNGSRTRSPGLEEARISLAASFSGFCVGWLVFSLRAAVESGLDLAEIEAIEAATKEPIDLGTLDRSALTKPDRVFVYAIACWIARLDGRVTEGESKALAELGERLGIPERPRALAEALAREIAELPEGDRPHRYDLERLRAAIGERLPKG